MSHKLKWLLFLSMIIMINITVQAAAAAQPSLPDDIKWLTNEADPVFASEDAQNGGTIHLGFLSFPLTFRTVGPDSNSSFEALF